MNNIRQAQFKNQYSGLRVECRHHSVQSIERRLVSDLLVLRMTHSTVPLTKNKLAALCKRGETDRQTSYLTLGLHLHPRLMAYFMD